MTNYDKCWKEKAWETWGPAEEEEAGSIWNVKWHPSEGQDGVNRVKRCVWAYGFQAQRRPRAETPREGHVPVKLPKEGGQSRERKQQR